MKVSRQVLNKSMLGLGGVAVAAVSVLGLTGAGSSLGSFMATITSQNNVISGSSVSLDVVQLQSYSMTSAPLAGAPVWSSDSRVTAAIGDMFPLLAPTENPPKETYFKITNTSNSNAAVYTSPRVRSASQHGVAIPLTEIRTNANTRAVNDLVSFSVLAKTSDAPGRASDNLYIWKNENLTYFLGDGLENFGLIQTDLPLGSGQDILILAPGQVVVMKVVGTVPFLPMEQLAASGIDGSGLSYTFDFSFALEAHDNDPILKANYPN